MFWREHCAGVDEVGRGPLAGPVYAAAVVLDPFQQIEGLRDSKKLSATRREQLAEEVTARAVACEVASASVAEIDEINILQASYLAMQRAVEALPCPVDFVVVDGNRLPDIAIAAEWLIKGDDKLDAIKAAAIVAKVTRDHEMQRLDQCYPEYGLAQHKGYPTPAHLEALRQHGPSPVHRMSFAPCRETRTVRRAR